MRLIIYMLLGLWLLTGEGQAAPLNSAYLNPVITKKALQAHAAFLSAEALEGRLTGTKGEKLATRYIAAIFSHLGLEPAGDKGTFFQPFDFTAGVSLGEKNDLSLTNQKGIKRHLVLNQEWRPLAFSDSHVFESAALVFAGFGITAKASGKLPVYDSYHGLNVKNKWVVVFRSMPNNLSAERNRQVYPYASLRYKAFTAKMHGAKGIIFAGGPHLVPLSIDTSLAGSGIIALSIKDTVLDDLLRHSNHPLNSLQKMQAALDGGQGCSLPVLSGINIAGQTDIKKNKQQGRNVLAKLRMGKNAARMLVIGAHVDHLGHGELSSRASNHEAGMIHPGADDNASGVASMLAAAAKLSALKAQGRLHGSKDIIFAAWSGEEWGILGSSHFVAHFMKTTKNKLLHPAIEAAINLDMVGHLRKGLVLQGAGSSAVWPKLIEQIKVHASFSVMTQSDPYLPTDSTSFYLHGVPTLNFFTGAYDDYHTPRDKAATLNYEGMQYIADYLVDLIAAIENTSSPIRYRAVQKNRDHAERNVKIYLGTIPDYASTDVSGVKISGVAKGSPAERAGIQHNDVVIELAGKKIHDIYDYTFVLNALPVGEYTKLIVLRGQAKMALVVVARYRE